MEQKLKVGQRVLFSGMKKYMKVRAASDRFAICTMPYNFRKETVIYTIVDYERNVRGMDNMVFGSHDYYSDEDCQAALKELESGELEVSGRRHRYVELDIVRVI